MGAQKPFSRDDLIAYHAYHGNGRWIGHETVWTAACACGWSQPASSRQDGAARWARHLGEQLDARAELETDALRPEVQWFAEQMEAKLRLNDYKGGWQDESPSYFLQRMADEWRELAHTIDLATMHEASPKDIIAECADIANFAMMVADVARKASP